MAAAWTEPLSTRSLLWIIHAAAWWRQADLYEEETGDEAPVESLARFLEEPTKLEEIMHEARLAVWSERWEAETKASVMEILRAQAEAGNPAAIAQLEESDHDRVPNASPAERDDR